MRIPVIILLMILSFSSANVPAYESLTEPHVMIYYRIPFGSTDAQTERSGFGLRLDKVTYTVDHIVDYQQLARQTAMLDLQFGHKGIEAIYLAGVDYLKMYHVNRQNEEQGEEEKYDDSLTMGERVRGVISDMQSVAPMGVYIGVGLGVGLLLGAGD